MLLIIAKDDLEGSSSLNSSKVHNIDEIDLDVRTKFYLLAGLNGHLVIEFSDINLIKSLLSLLGESRRKLASDQSGVVISPSLSKYKRDDLSEEMIRDMYGNELAYLSEQKLMTGEWSYELPYSVFSLLTTGNFKTNLIDEPPEEQSILRFEHALGGGQPISSGSFDEEEEEDLLLQNQSVLHD